MNARLIASHLAVAVLAFGSAYVVFSPGGFGKRSLQRPDDAVASFAEVVQITDPHDRAQALVDYFATADPASAERLRDAVNQPDSKIVLDEMSETLFASWWARSDPEAAFKKVVDPGWTNRHPWVREVMRAWVASDPLRAAEAAGTLPPNPDRGKVEATRVLVDHWWDKPISEYPIPLFALIHGLEPQPRGLAIEHLIRSSVEKRGIDATEQFIESLPKSDDLGMSVENELRARFGQVLVELDVDRAIRWAAKHGEDREDAGILRHLAYTWGKKDGPAAMRWAMALPDPQRPQILFRVWLSFRQTEPDEARNWLLAQEPSGALESIYQRYLTGEGGLDAKQALEIAERATDPKVRERLFAAVAVGWIQTDPEAAKKWLDTVELAPELEDRVRKAVLAPAPAQPTAPISND